VADVFLSYSRRDGEFVRRLAAALQERGKDVWVDVEGIRDAEVFPEALRRAVEASDAFVFVLSPDSVGSSFCVEEVEHAASLNKRIVPLALRPVTDVEVPEGVRVRNWIPAGGEWDFETTVARVLKALDTDLEWEREHSRLTVRALEWEQAGRDSSFLLRGADLKAAERWLASSAGKDPGPTALEREYLLAARVRVRRTRTLMAAGSLAMLGAIGALRALLATPAAGVHVDSNSVAVIAPRTNSVIASVPVGVRPSELSIGGGALWVANLGDGTVSEIDLRTRRVIHTLATGTTAAATIAGATAGSGAIWTLDNNAHVRRVDLIDDSIRTANVRPTGYAAWVSGPDVTAAGVGGVWVITGHSSVARLNPNSGRRLDDIALGTYPTSLAVGDHAVWVSDGLEGTVSRIDLSSSAVTKTIPLSPGLTGIAVGAGGVWVTNTLDGTVTRIDPTTGRATNTIDVGQGPRGVAAGAGAVWVANSRAGTVSRIDPRLGQVVATIHVGQSPEDVSVVRGSVYVSVQAGGPTFATSSGALTLRIVAPIDPLQSTDPAVGPSDAVLGEQLAYLTCATLLNYPDRPAPEGTRLVPDVARAMPTLTNAGRTYTFMLRPGVRFSPPSGAAVTAQAFKRAIERGLNPKMGSYYGALVSDIVGARAYAAGRAATIVGVSARGLRLTIRLVAPAPDFLARISTDGFCAVPGDTPIDPKGVEGIPSAGPYYVARHVPGQSLLLARNPNYSGSRPRAVKQIAVTVGIDGNAALHDVLYGTADYTLTVPPGAIGSLSRYGPASDAARVGGQQYFEEPLLGYHYLAFNVHRPLFASAALRQAVNYALDRTALSSVDNAKDPVQGHRPAAQYLQPGMPGYQPAVIYPLGAPDLARGRRLARGPIRHGVIYGYTLPPGPQLAQIVQADLAAIGIDMQIKLFGKVSMFARLTRLGEPWDIALTGWGVDYPDPEDEVNTLFASSAIPPPNVPFGNGAQANFGGFSNPAFDRRMRAAALLMNGARYRTYGALANDLARYAAPVAAWSQPVSRNLFAARIGCQTYQPIYGFDLAMLCLRHAAR
jgi:YVTN family beta-propeller protein